MSDEHEHRGLSVNMTSGCMVVNFYLCQNLSDDTPYRNNITPSSGTVTGYGCYLVNYE